MTHLPDFPAQAPWARTSHAVDEPTGESSSGNRPPTIPITETETVAAKTATVLADYRLAVLSRHAAEIGRREVLSGRAKFGIFGDGKELAQIALAHVFRPGDFRSGYYRDQTLMLATGMVTLTQFFAQLYAHDDVTFEPASAGRSMVAHFSTRLVDADGHWLSQQAQPNTAADISPTAGQMPRLVGLAHASHLYREIEALQAMTEFSQQGNEVAFATIGNASTAEGHFWEALNAIGVLQAPAVISIWDDGYGISVANEHQLTKRSLRTMLAGFRREHGEERGFHIYGARGWDYPRLLRVYHRAALHARNSHIPAVIHVTELTQPLGHSTSGSHERYKSRERLAWEAQWDPLRRMRRWILAQGYAGEDELAALEKSARQEVDEAQAQAWQAVSKPLKAAAADLEDLLDEAALYSAQADDLTRLREELSATELPLRRTLIETAQKALMLTRTEENPVRTLLADWKQNERTRARQRYGRHLTSEWDESALLVPAVAPAYADDAPDVRGFELLKANFDALLARDPRVVIFGEDVGALGGVNQALAGLQAKYGPLRVADTGIRETTIIGQAIGLALRGLRPIAEIQYLDYILYAIQTLADDLATLHWRSAGGQKAPVIVRTRGHRLEGIWHSGSPMGALLHLLRGMHVLVPRNMTQAAGFYNTLLRADEPALVVEVLNGYRLREPLPANPGEFTVPLGLPEILRPGGDVTLVTYGANCRIALAAAARLNDVGVQVEVLDVQSLLPFDRPKMIVESLKKTGRLVILDEDVPGGASAFILQQILEEQGGYFYLDSQPQTITAQPHRPAYGTDGDYFSKPNVEDVFDRIYGLMQESDPARYPLRF